MSEHAVAASHEPPPDPRELLAEYRALLAAAGKVRPVVLLPPRTSRLGHLRVRPRFGLGTHFFVVHHVRRSVRALGRLYQLGVALHPEQEGYEDGSKQIEAFDKFVPTHRPRLTLVAGLVLVLGAAFLLARYVADDIDPTLGALFAHEGELLTMATSAEPLRKMTGASLTLDPGGFADGVRSLGCLEEGKESVCSLKRGVTSTVASFILIAISIWLVAFLPNSAFRLKRALFNLGPEGAEELGARPAGTFGTRADGVYLSERRFFARLGAAPPREVPFDLVSQAMLVVVPIWLGVLAWLYASYAIYLFRSGLFGEDWKILSGLYFLGLFALALGVARLIALRRCYLLRNPSPRAPAAPVERPVAKRRARAAAFAIDAVAVVGLVLLLRQVVNSFVVGAEARELLLVFLLPPLAWLVYDAVALAFWHGASIGKVVLRLEVVRASTGERLRPARMLARDCLAKGFLFGPAAWAPLQYLEDLDEGFLAILVLASFFALLLEYLWPLWGYRGRTFHDFVCDTVVVRRPPRPEAVPAAAATA